MFILCLSGIILGRYCRESLAKNGGFRKKIKRGDGHMEGVVFRRGVQTFTQYEYFIFVFCYLKKGHVLFLRYFRFYKILLILNLNIDSMKEGNM